MPSRPAIYPPGSRFYVVPVTFEVELLDRAAMEQIAGQAEAPPDREDPAS
ncbi:MAG: hypothetical protein ACE5JG_11250 [Planctomycetota bacterium]